jgi:V/A-type H+-transporting ATPase subunit E
MNLPGGIMDVKLESLIEKIQKEGVEQAEQKSDQIIKEAHKKEKEIIKKAQEEAKKTREEGKKEAEKFQKSAESSLQQAARNVVLSVKEKLTFIFNAILKKELKEALTPELVAKILENIVGKWAEGRSKSLEVLVSHDDKEKVEELLFLRFKEEAKKGIEIKSSESFGKGFQIGIKGEDAYYDFSDQGITEALSVFLNPAISDLISIKKNG